jgi:hypothetical protein
VLPINVSANVLNHSIWLSADEFGPVEAVGRDQW